MAGKTSKRLRKAQDSDTASEDDVFMDQEAETFTYEEGKEFGIDDESDEVEDDDDDEMDDDEEEEDFDSEWDEEEMGNEENEESNNAEIEELEKERRELHHEEQDLVKNLKRQKDEDFLKGQAVKNQKALWDKTLEFRFLLQKAFSSSNRLPQEPIRSSFCDSGNETSEAYAELINSSEKTLDSILELQKALLEKNPSITQGADVDRGQTPKQSEASIDSNDEGDQAWLQISQMHSRMASFRDKSIDKWQRKTQVTTGAAAIRGRLQAFNQNISDQVAAYMRDPSRMVKGMQQMQSNVTIFGTVLDSSSNTKEEGADADGDPELLDDSDFYQQLLKEFFETFDSSSSETAFYALKRLQTKKRKIVDRRASKSRKIRYNVHEKIVNFMAPKPMDLPLMAPKLFENLFGLKKQKSTAVAGKLNYTPSDQSLGI